MFERWTDRSRRSLVLAQEQARVLNHQEVSAGHMLLGLLLEGESTAYQALAALGASADSATDELAKIRPRGEWVPPGHVPFTPSAKKACQDSLRESLAAGVRYIGPEHVLLALVRDYDGEVAVILGSLGITAENVRAKVAELLGTYEKADQPEPVSIAIARVAEPDPYHHEHVFIDRDARPATWRTRCHRTDVPLEHTMTPAPGSHYSVTCPACLRIGALELLLDDILSTYTGSAKPNAARSIVEQSRLAGWRAARAAGERT